MSSDLTAHCVCQICKRNQDFRIPSELLNAVTKGKLVVFAGGGISTEDRVVLPNTFYEGVADDISVNKSDALDFPTLMSRFCNRPNGRQKLITRIAERLAYVKSFPELYGGATAFHRELSTIFQIDTIITTNWDDFFERECAAIPYVSAETLASGNFLVEKYSKFTAPSTMLVQSSRPLKTINGVTNDSRPVSWAVLSRPS